MSGLLHWLAHLTNWNGCLPESYWEGEVLMMRLRCIGCGELQEFTLVVPAEMEDAK